MSQSLGKGWTFFSNALIDAAHIVVSRKGKAILHCDHLYFPRRMDSSRADTTTATGRSPAQGGAMRYCYTSLDKTNCMNF